MHFEHLVILGVFVVVGENVKKDACGHDADTNFATDAGLALVQVTILTQFHRMRKILQLLTVSHVRAEAAVDRNLLLLTHSDSK